MPSFLSPELRDRRTEKKASPLIPCRDRDVREAESVVTGALRFLTHLPHSSFFRVTCPSDFPEALIPWSPLHLSPVWHLHSLTLSQLSLGVQSQLLWLPVVGTETLAVTQPYVDSQAQLE